MKTWMIPLASALASLATFGQSASLATKALAQGTAQPAPMQAQYQTNSVLAYASIDGEDNAGGTTPIAAAKWVNERTLITLQAAGADETRFLAISTRPVVSLAQGAWLTPAGQLFNLDLGDPGLYVVDVTHMGSAFPLKLAAPAAFAMQLIVISPHHQDGFAISAPLDLRYAYAQGQDFEFSVDPGRLEECPIRVTSTPTVTGALGPFESTASVGPQTKGTVTLQMEGQPAISRQVSIDNSTGVMSSDAVVVSSLGSLFASVTPTASSATVTMVFENPIAIDIGGVQPIVTPAKTWVTDKGCPIVTSMDGYPSCPDMTQGEADMALCSIGLKGMVTQTCPPSDAYDCHGYTFTCGTKWINNDQVAKILADNGYTAKSNDSGGVSPGNIVVYRDPMGNVTHSGVVTKVDPMGNPTEIESKWGRSAKYKHAPGTVPPGYGTPTYYCTTRCLGNKLKCKSAKAAGGETGG